MKNKKKVKKLVKVEKEIVCRIISKNAYGFKNFPGNRNIIIRNISFIKRLKFLIFNTMTLESANERIIYYKNEKDKKLRKGDIIRPTATITSEEC